MNNKIEELRKELATLINDNRNKLAEEINARINEVEKEMKQTESQGKWKPKQGEWYYVANPVNLRFYEEYEWGNDEIDKLCYNAGLIRKTPEEATEIGKRMYYRQWFRDLSDVTEEMWMESSINKFYAYYDWDVEQVCYDSRIMYMCEATYFTSEEKLNQAIETIGGEDILKRYVLGVE